MGEDGNDNDGHNDGEHVRNGVDEGEGGGGGDVGAEEEAVRFAIEHEEVLPGDHDSDNDLDWMAQLEREFEPCDANEDDGGVAEAAEEIAALEGQELFMQAIAESSSSSSDGDDSDGVSVSTVSSGMVSHVTTLHSEAEVEEDAGAAPPTAGPPSAPRPPPVPPELDAHVAVNRALAVPGLRRQRGPALDRFHFPGGYLKVKWQDRTIYAHCTDTAHGGPHECRRTRTAKFSAGRPGQGRPLGHLIAWLAAGHAGVTQEIHRDRDVIPSWEDRNRARNVLIAAVAADPHYQALADTEEGPEGEERPFAEPPDVV